MIVGLGYLKQLFHPLPLAKHSVLQECFDAIKQKLLFEEDSWLGLVAAVRFLCVAWRCCSDVCLSLSGYYKLLLRTELSPLPSSVPGVVTYSLHANELSNLETRQDFILDAITHSTVTEWVNFLLHPCTHVNVPQEKEANRSIRNSRPTSFVDNLLIPLSSRLAN